MKEVGLTHGGFYAHFASRDAMLAEAADRAGAESVAALTRVAAASPPQEALRSMVRAYLAKEHVDGVEQFVDARILYGPGKAANAGGVAVSGLEMAQNSMRYAWTREEVDNRLRIIMKSIHEACVETADRFGCPGNYVNGANIAGFLKVADAMMDHGLV